MNPITPERYLEPAEDKPNYTLCPVCRYMPDQCECNDYFKEEECTQCYVVQLYCV